MAHLYVCTILKVLMCSIFMMDIAGLLTQQHHVHSNHQLYLTKAVLGRCAPDVSNITALQTVWDYFFSQVGNVSLGEYHAGDTINPFNTSGVNVTDAYVYSSFVVILNFRFSLMLPH